MVAISRSAGSYAMIASASLKPNADALRKVAQAAGGSISTTQTTLSDQSRDLRRFVERVSQDADAAASLETTRGLNRSAEVSSAVVEALKAMEQRFAYVQSRNSSRPSATAGNSQGAALVAMLRAAGGGDDRSFDFSALIRQPSASRVKPDKITVNAGKQDQPDVFERGIPLTTAVGGTATTSVTKTALTAAPAEVLLDKSNPGLGGIQSVIYQPDGSARADNEGFMVKTTTGAADDTVVLDTRDPTAEDTRFASIEVDAGDGSDVVFIAGNNSSRVNAGAGDDFVAVEGDGIVDGGDGNDLIYARTASGDAGEDVIFTDGFASGGDGNDVITVFSLDAENDTTAKLAYGGSGDDQIVATVEAAIDGGDGDDVLILREGGSAGGGAGNDKISAWAAATVEGGDGNDDIYLIAGGSVDAGAGNDTIETVYYTEAAGGQGDDTTTMNGGGVYTFRKGDGSDKVVMDETKFQLDDKDRLRVNRVVLDGFDYADLAVDIDALKLSFVPTGANASRDSLQIERADLLGKMELVFRKNGFEQVMKLDGLTQTMGPRLRYTAPAN